MNDQNNNICHVCHGEKKTRSADPCLCCHGIGTIDKTRRLLLTEISQAIRKQAAERGIEIPE